MDTLGIGATQEEVDMMVNEIDQDGNGEIDFEGERAFIASSLFAVVLELDYGANQPHLFM